MTQKILILIPFFYILALLQTSFWFSLPFILIAVILISFFTSSASLSPGISSAFIGGLFLDVFSNHWFGFWVLILLGIVIFIKILRKYVRFSIS